MKRYVLACLLPACVSPAEPSYRGERLLSLTAVATLAEGVAPPNVDARLFWFVDGATAAISPERATDIPGEYPAWYPAAFRLDIYTPPPDHAFVTVGDTRVAFAAVGVTSTSVDSHLAGTAEQYVIVYLDEQYADGSPAHELFGRAVGVGYNVTRLHPDPTTVGGTLGLVPTVDDFVTTIEVVIRGRGAYRWPALDWTKIYAAME